MENFDPETGEGRGAAPFAGRAGYEKTKSRLDVAHVM